ncbi:hypothetical protein ABFS83_04G066800 [Erythranthe nasuta]
MVFSISSNFSAAAARKLVTAVVVVVAACVAVGIVQQAEAQSRVPQCIVSCSQDAISCAFKNCRISGGGTGALACYQGCGATNLACLVSCLGTQILPKPPKCS